MEAVNSFIKTSQENQSEVEIPVYNEPAFVPRWLFHRRTTKYKRQVFEVKNLNNHSFQLLDKRFACIR